MYTHLQKLVNSISDVCGVFNWQTKITFWPTGIRIQTNNWFLIPIYSASCHKVRAITTCWDYYVSPIYIALCIFWPVHNIIQHIKYRKTQSTKQYTPKLLVKKMPVKATNTSKFWAEFKSYFSTAYISSPTGLLILYCFFFNFTLIENVTKTVRIFWRSITTHHQFSTTMYTALVLHLPHKIQCLVILI